MSDDSIGIGVVALDESVKLIYVFRTFVMGKND